ncbi:hypothetical protein [Micromonospora sp. NPDC007230]|uniref:hypothetical protein n=1 Tax=Micromonospora sp. NPDC007230 TaxID=3364237 RepID=UPI0036AAAEE6
MSRPLTTVAPARTRATMCGALAARQGAWAASLGLNAYLRTINMIIMCVQHTWTVESDTAIYALTPAGSFLAAPAKIPAQRDGDHAKREDQSRLV